MTETTRRRLTITAEIIRQTTLVLTLVVLAIATLLAAINYLIPRRKATAERKALTNLRVTWAATVRVARALYVWWTS